MITHFAADYFNFTAKERTGIICILILIILFLVLPFLFPYFISRPQNDILQFEKEIAALNIKQQEGSGKSPDRNFDENNYQNYYQPSEKNYYTKQTKGELFYFDPNTLPVEGWVKLGIREKTANSINKYVSKGGRFYKPEDIAKIWGLHDDEVKRLLPYVRITPKPQVEYSSYKNTETYKAYEKPAFKIENIDINKADTAAFIALPGIGSKLANRIIAFREKLGGFYKIEQVAETFALPDSVFQKIKINLIVSDAATKKLDINSATVDELKAHPYIRYNIANAIVQYRLQHGAFSTVSDIKKILIVTDDIFNKAEPYLTLR
ncbi:MAG: helix-hairpin-helix domain-containing protein [Ferruginibacter sp.]